jgi:hypothetical protein
LYITDHICNTLTMDPKHISPTQFHNSVHNAPSGYWAISSGNRAPSIYVGGFKDSFAVAFLEAAVICISKSQPVVMAAYDIQTNAPLVDTCGITESFGCALVLDSRTESDRGWPVKIVHQAIGEGKSVCENPYIRYQMEANPAARCLPLFDAFATERAVDIAWPTGAETSLHVHFDG